jgi:hypothetical protein
MKTPLVARGDCVFSSQGKYLFSVSLTNRFVELLSQVDRDPSKESWLEYRERTEDEREIEKQKQYQMASDLVAAYNEMYCDTPGLPLTHQEATVIADWFNIPAEDLLDSHHQY